jgi:UDP-N-acetylglucosamine 2-epimerase (non-hydrolysing)
MFIHQLKFTLPKYNLHVGSHSVITQTAKMMLGLENIFNKEKPDIVLVLGDTNSVLAGALVATKLHIKIGHIESGLRSYDNNMPEELNRIVVDHISDLLFAPTQSAGDILKKEGIDHKKIFVTGNTIVDAVYANYDFSKSLDSEYKSKSYFLATVHRIENVDNQDRFESIIDSLKKVSSRYQMPVIFPIHPHSKNKAKIYKIDFKGLDIIEPVGYFQFLNLECNARLILTDSGGVQEEACILKVPCVTLRDNTERPETIEVGANIIGGVEAFKVLECVGEMLASEKNWTNPFGDGYASKRIVEVLK